MANYNFVIQESLWDTFSKLGDAHLAADSNESIVEFLTPLPEKQKRGTRPVCQALASFSRPDLNRPFAMSIFIALYLSGAACAVDPACSASAVSNVFPLKYVNMYGLLGQFVLS